MITIRMCICIFAITERDVRECMAADMERGVLTAPLGNGAS